MYYPSYAYNAYQFWKYYDPMIIRRDMSYAKSAGINAFRIWVSYEYWLENPTHFQASYESFLELADQMGIQVLTSLFDGCGEADSEQTRGRYYADSYCITSPSAEIYSNPDRYDEPLAFVTWFLGLYKNDKRHLGIEIYNEPWGDQRADLAEYLCREAVKIQGCVPLSVGSAPSERISIAKSVQLGMDMLQYHDNFPASAEAFRVNAERQVTNSQMGNLPTYCTEVQWVGGPTQYPAYENLAPTVEELCAEYEWVPFYWTLMVHPGYLKEIRNQVQMTNGIFQEDGNPWSVEALQAIAPEMDVSDLEDNQTSVFTQYYYRCTFSDDFSDRSAYKWTADAGEWSAASGAMAAPATGTALADLTDFADFGATLRLTAEEGAAGLLFRYDGQNGYFAGVYSGRLVIRQVTGGELGAVLAQVSLDDAGVDNGLLHVKAQGSRLTATLNGLVLEAEDSAYTTGQLGLLTYRSAGAEFDDLVASVGLFAAEDIPEESYTGSPIEPQPVITVGDKVLQAGEDYALSYMDNTDVGEGQVLVNGLGAYTDSISLPFRIVPRDLADEAVEALPIPDQVAGDSPLTPQPILQLGNYILEEGKDYTLTYSSNSRPGTGRINLTGQGNFTGQLALTFIILPSPDVNSVEEAIRELPTGFTRENVKTVARAYSLFCALTEEEQQEVDIELREALEDATVAAGMVNHTQDDFTVVSGLPWYVQLTCTQLPVREAEAPEGYEIYWLYQVSFVTLVGSSYPLDDVTLRVVSPDTGLEVVYLGGEENIFIPAEYDNGQYTFTAEGRGLYALVMQTEPPAVIPGDLDKDGIVSITDIMLACRIIARGETPTADELRRGDLTEDGRINIEDVMAQCRILARQAR